MINLQITLEIILIQDAYFFFLLIEHIFRNLFRKSLYKNNIENLINDKNLKNYLKNKNIKLILIQHHLDKYHRKIFNINSSAIIKIKNHFHLSRYIKKCSLLVTDFSSISFSFMFQNKPILYYLVDFYDNISFPEKKYLRINDPLQFGNYYLDKNELIEKIKYYADNNFQISNLLKAQYESVFYYKHNATIRISEIIKKILKGI